jgi:hypothetical protein
MFEVCILLRICGDFHRVRIVIHWPSGWPLILDFNDCLLEQRQMLVFTRSRFDDFHAWGQIAMDFVLVWLVWELNID